MMSDYAEDLREKYRLEEELRLREAQERYKLKNNLNNENEQDYNYRRHYFYQCSDDLIQNIVTVIMKKCFFVKKMEDEHYLILLDDEMVPVFVYDKHLKKISNLKTSNAKKYHQDICNEIINFVLKQEIQNVNDCFSKINSDTLNDIQNIVKCADKNDDFLFLRPFSWQLQDKSKIVIYMDNKKERLSVVLDFKLTNQGYSFIPNKIELEKISVCKGEKTICWKYKPDFYSLEEKWNFCDDTSKDAYFHNNLSLKCNCNKDPRKFNKTKCKCGRIFYYYTENIHLFDSVLNKNWYYSSYENFCHCRLKECCQEFYREILSDEKGFYLLHKDCPLKLNFKDYVKNNQKYLSKMEWKWVGGKKRYSCSGEEKKYRNFVIESASEKDIKTAYQDLLENKFYNRLKTDVGKKIVDMCYYYTKTRSGPKVKIFLEQEVLPILDNKSYVYGTFDERQDELQKLEEKYQEYLVQYEKDVENYKFYLEDVPYSLEEDDMFKTEEIDELLNEDTQVDEEKVDELLKNLNENLSQIKRHPFESDLIDGDF